MATDVLDLENLLAPLDAGDQGAGIDLRLDFSASSAYQRLRDARSAARAEERARDADGDTDAPEALGWREVLQVGEQALATQSKDLEIAAWMTEALVRVHGLRGLATGARLITGLCDRYWDAVFPLPDEDGLEVRASPIGGLSGASSDGTVMQPLRRLPLFRRADGTSVGVYHWDQAEQTAALEESKRQARYDAGAVDLKTLEAESRLDKGFLVGTGREAVAAAAAWAALETALDTRFGGESPSVRKVKALLERMVEIIGRLGGLAEDDAVGNAEDGAPAPADGAAVTPLGTATAAGAGGALTREAALRELDRIADFFRKSEPHSPLAYTLDEAVRRGRMTLAELLMEVLPDADARNGMLQRLGIRPEES